MLSLRGDAWILTMSEDGTDVVIEDRLRNARWHLDKQTRFVSKDTERFNEPAYNAESAAKPESTVQLIGKGQARYTGTDTISATHATLFGKLTLRWTMKPDRLLVSAEADDSQGVNAMTLPGVFRPEGSGSFSTAIPNGQGVLHTGRGPAFYNPRWGQGAGGFSMAMFGQITEKNALLTIAETDADAVLHWEKTSSGELRVMWRQEPSLGKLSYSREVVLFPCAPGLTNLCKLYRRYEIEKGRFKTWEEKISQRPKLENLFGSAMIFTGYNFDKELDYNSAFRKLKAAGIDKAYVYPVYYSQNLNDEANKKLTTPWADYRNLLGTLKELNYMAGSFIYIMDSPTDNESDLRFGRDKQPIVYWEMEGIKWRGLSNEKRVELNKNIIDAEHKQLDGIHYDTLTCGPFLEDYNPEHIGDGASEKAARKRMLDYAAEKGLIISSEGFWGRMTGSYDLGNTKYSNMLGGDEYCIVPMTMLVYHDCAYHTWWEVDNYNNPEHLSQYGRGYWQRLPWGGGTPTRQAAVDAIMGTPPDIFPFGMQWNFVPHTKNLYYYKPVFEDVIVQEAINCAKPVMALNKKIGKLEMVEHRLHRPDGAVQETVFSDGTRVVANFANVLLESPGIGLLKPQSWISL